MIDLALQTKDFEWIKQIHKQRELDMSKGNPETSYYSKSTALENITNSMAVLESKGIRNFRSDSDYDMQYSTLIQTEKQSYTVGECVNYNLMTEEVRIYTYGYLEGYKASLQNVTDQYYTQPTQTNAAADTFEKEKKKRNWRFWKSKDEKRRYINDSLES